MAPNRGPVLARRLAAHVEAMIADPWRQAPHVALLRPQDEVECVVLRSICEPAESSIAGLPLEIGAAACVTALGYVGRSDQNDRTRRRARITVAATCCSAATILRFRDGDVLRSDEAEGPLVGMLRSWSGLGRYGCSTMDASEIDRCFGP